MVFAFCSLQTVVSRVTNHFIRLTRIKKDLFCIQCCKTFQEEIYISQKLRKPKKVCSDALNLNWMVQNKAIWANKPFKKFEKLPIFVGFGKGEI